MSGRANAAGDKEIRLYAIDCGSLTFKDMSMFSDTGHYDGKKNGSMVDPCFLLQHPAGFFLWDTGLGDALVGHDPPVNEAGVGLHVQKTLVGQLAQIGVRPADIKVLAFSHFHVDHTGNANLFTAATWLINEEELRWALGKPTPPVVVPESFNAYKNVQTRMISGDYDVFGDGTIRILRTPGHTPGHQVLLVKLAHTGPVLLSGDLYHLASDRPRTGDGAGQVMTADPGVNESRGVHLEEHGRPARDSTRSGGFCILAEIPGISQLGAWGWRRAVGSIADAVNSVGGTMSASITVPNDNTSMAQNVRLSACSMARRICDAPGVKAAAFSS
jgi:glyoxylase-like metal-dependent hydrolase (beta-lactamase superfamily II)